MLYKFVHCDYLSSSEQITANDKRRLQNVMAYGEYGKNINLNPKERKEKKPSAPPKVEADRFDEGQSHLANLHVHFKIAILYILLCAIQPLATYM